MAKLIVQDVGQTVLIDLDDDESLTIGRSSNCDVPIAAERASRRHVEVRGGSGGHRLVDLGSTNGTAVNGAPLAASHLLADGDRVDVGGCLVLYRR